MKFLKKRFFGSKSSNKAGNEDFQNSGVSKNQITADKLAINKKYGGDIDMWARMDKLKEKSIMNDEDWYFIEWLIQDFKLIRKGLEADSYASEAKTKKISKACDNPETEESFVGNINA